MKKIRVAIIGYGNIGKYSLNAVLSSPDLELVGVVRRNPSDVPAELKDVKVVKSIKELSDVKVAILATPTREVETTAKECLALGINTVDSFDIHTGIVNLRRELDKVAKAHNVASIISAGWDPGTDSMIRSMFEFMAPKGITYTNFGPGMSMGHSVAVKAIDGVKDALSETIPLGTSIHRRMVFVEMEKGREKDFDKVVKAIKADDYFAHDETHIQQVESVKDLQDMGHGVNMVRRAVSGTSHNQMLELNMKINNPALTAQILIASARAVVKQQPGSYTMIEVPIIDYIFGEREALVKKLI